MQNPSRRFLARFGWVLFLVCGAGCRRTPVNLSDPGQGITLALAEERAKTIQDLRYDLSFAIPEKSTDPVEGRAVIRFSTPDASAPIVLDFAPGADSLTSISVAGKHVQFRVVSG